MLTTSYNLYIKVTFFIIFHFASPVVSSFLPFGAPLSRCVFVVYLPVLGSKSSGPFSAQKRTRQQRVAKQHRSTDNWWNPDIQMIYKWYVKFPNDSKIIQNIQRYTRMIKDNQRIVVGNWFCQFFSIELNITYIQKNISHYRIVVPKTSPQCCIQHEFSIELRPQGPPFGYRSATWLTLSLDLRFRTAERD